MHESIKYTTVIKYLPSEQNVVADSLSRVEAIRLAADVKFVELSLAQKDDDELQSLLINGTSSLNLSRMLWGPDETPVVCDLLLAGEIICPYVPVSLRRRVFSIFRDSSHPSGKVTDRVIRKSYVWLGMNKDIKEWCRSCVECQKSKVTRHVVLQLSHFVAPDGRFRHVHMHIVGLLPTCEDLRYCLTIIDRFSRWPEAIPLKNVEAKTIYRAFVDGWISRFGTPETFTTDQDSQF